MDVLSSTQCSKTDLNKNPKSKPKMINQKGRESQKNKALYMLEMKIGLK